MGQPRQVGELWGKPCCTPSMVDHSQASQLTLGLRHLANAGRRKQGIITPTLGPSPSHQPGEQSRRRLPPGHRQHQRQTATSGFTLVELLIVVGIIGVLSTVALPAFLGQQNKATVNAANVRARGLMSYCLSYFISNGKMPESGNTEYARLSKDPGYNIIKWNSSRTNNMCKVSITSASDSLSLSPEGIFSIEASGDETKVQATAAKI